MRIFTCLFLFCFLVGSVFGQDGSETVDELLTRFAEPIAEATISTLISEIEGTMPFNVSYPGMVRTSPDTYFVKTILDNGDERIVVTTTNHILGVVAKAITQTGFHSEEQYQLFRRVAVNSQKWVLESAITDANSIRGTLVRNGRRYGFSLEYFPQNKQLVMTVTRQ